MVIGDGCFWSRVISGKRSYGMGRRKRVSGGGAIRARRVHRKISATASGLGAPERSLLPLEKPDHRGRAVPPSTSFFIPVPLHAADGPPRSSHSRWPVAPIWAPILSRVQEMLDKRLIDLGGAQTWDLRAAK